jgi:hypothetical protein
VRLSHAAGESVNRLDKSPIDGPFTTPFPCPFVEEDPLAVSTPSPILVNVLDDLSISRYLIPVNEFHPGSFGGAACNVFNKA